MAEFSDARSMTEQAAAEATEQVTKANRNTLNFLFGAQRLVLDEFVFASNELLERARTETHLFTEFVSKMAGVHSVRGIQEMATECGQHQIDFIRRDSERVFTHGQRMVDAAYRCRSHLGHRAAQASRSSLSVSSASPGCHGIEIPS